MSEFFVEIEGSKQGKFHGESTKKGHEEQLVGVAFEHSLTSGVRPLRSRSSPLPQASLWFMKPWGAASPQLFSALQNDEVLVAVRFEFVRSADGREEPLRRIELKNARVVAMEQLVGRADALAAEEPLELERVSLSFVGMTIDHFPGTTVVNADATPIAAESSRPWSSQRPRQGRGRRVLERGRVPSAADFFGEDELKILRQMARERATREAADGESDERTR